MAILEVHLFGKLSVQHDGQELPGFDVRKVQELLCYLLLYRDRPHSRESLASLLWGNTSAALSKKYLRQSLWQLQAALDARGGDVSQHLLNIDADWININPDFAFQIDIAIFEDAYREIQRAKSTLLDPGQFESLCQAAALYRGGLLEGCYEDWCLYERERLENSFCYCLDKLIDHAAATRQLDLGLAFAMRLLQMDRARERTHRHLMRLYYLSGDRTAALRQFSRCTAALRDDLDVAPSELTHALYSQIKADHLSPVVEMAEPVAPLGLAPQALSPMLDRLKRFESVIADLQQRLQQDIRAIEQLLAHNR
jgi:DNA-binding SARP family transcriptional activator